MGGIESVITTGANTDCIWLRRAAKSESSYTSLGLLVVLDDLPDLDVQTTRRFSLSSADC